MRTVMVGGVVLGFLCGASGAGAQSLGELARQEEARREGIRQPAKVYTNESLRGSGLPPPAGVPVAPVPSVAGAAETVQDAPAAAEEPLRDETYWRGRVDAARTALSRAQTFQVALQTRIDALSTDFVNRDDPAQRNVIALERQKTVAELARVTEDIAAQQRAITGIQDEARRANVPAGWVR